MADSVRQSVSNNIQTTTYTANPPYLEGGDAGEENINVQLAQKAHYNDVVYLADYITNFNKTATTYYGADTALNNAITACKSGGLLILPIGQIFISSTININNPITILGGLGSVIEQQGQCDAFYVNCDNVHFINVEIENTLYWNSSNYATMQAGDFTGIRFHTGRRHIVDKCTILGWSTGIHFENCDFFSVTNNYINKCFNYDIVVENQGNPDSGDSVIHGNVLNGSPASTQTTALIKYRSGGGLKVTDNKLLTGQIGIQTLIPSNVRTGVLIVEGNSIEGQTLHCLQMGYETGATNASFVRTIISCNEFEPNNCTGDAIVLDGSIILSSMKDVLFQGNHINGTPNTLNAINVNGITNILISDNEIWGGSNGILIGSSTQNIQIHDNMILKTATTSIKNSGYAQMYRYQMSNVKQTVFWDFSNSSKTTALNTILASFGSTASIAHFKLTVDVNGSINSPANESFYIHQEYYVYAATNGGAFNSATLINSTTSGLPVTVTYASNGQIAITRNDSYADGTYTISGNVKVTVDGNPYNVGVSNIGDY